jgi:hypothetical protein
MLRFFLSLILLLGVFLSASAKTPIEALLVAPLDTLAVRLDSTVDATALANASARRKAPSGPALVARTFHPAFGAAIALAARKVEVLDSSAAAAPGAPRLLRFSLDKTSGDSLTFAVPVLPADSARYVLVLGRLAFSQATVSVPRRYLPPTEPAFDPATGTLTPGNRKGYAEGPGRVTTLTARAHWLIWDNTTQAPAVRGVAAGESSFRGSAGKNHWEKAARELAKSLLKQTDYSPF